MGVGVHAPSRPDEMVSSPTPVPKEFFHPRPICSMGAPSGFAAQVLGIGRGAMGLAEGVSAGDQCDGFFVVHRHAGEGLTDVAGRGHRIGVFRSGLRG